MSYRNSVKLLTSNFSIVWKQLLYTFLTLLIVFFIAYGTSQPIISTLNKEGVINELKSIFENIYTSPKDVVTSITTTFNHFFDVLSVNFKSLWLSIFSTFFVVFVLYHFLKSISMFNVSSVMYYKLTSFATIGYTQNLISTLAKSCRFALAYVVYKIPFIILKLLLLYAFFELVSSPLSIIIGLFLVSVVFILLTSLELTIFSPFAPCMLEKNGSAFKAFFRGNKKIIKSFFRIFSSAIIVVLTLIVVNVFLALFTLGSALLITLPASIVFICIFNLCAYFGAVGERYYLSKNSIATPLNGENKKLEQ